MKKTCSKCGEEKELTDFPKHKGCLFGYSSRCSLCASIYRKERYIKNIKKIKKYRDEHKKERSEYDRKRREEKHEEISLKKIEYHEKNREKDNERSRKWMAKNKEHTKSYFENLSAEKKQERARKRLVRRRTNYREKIKHNFSSLLYQRLRRRHLNKKFKSTFDYLPYTIDDLTSHLESLWEPWMNWNNYGNKKGEWTIDHIIPDFFFKYKEVGDFEFLKCWALNNLQPMEFLKNVKKSNKLV